MNKMYVGFYLSSRAIFIIHHSAFIIKEKQRDLYATPLRLTRGDVEARAVSMLTEGLVGIAVAAAVTTPVGQ
jgi:hypothetical protein